MRAVFTLLCLAVVSQVYSNDFSNFPSELPLCSSSEVRLSPRPVACLPDFGGDEDFEIPELKLDLRDLEKIFQGAESSGGHVIGPMNGPRRGGGPVTPFPVTLTCEASVLSDGKKRVSFLSKQEFTLNQNNYEINLMPQSWEHYLIKGRNIRERRLVAVNATPSKPVPRLKVSLGYNELYHKLALTVCEEKSTLKKSQKDCARSLVRVGESHVEAIKFKEVESNNFYMARTTLVSCQIR